MPTSPPKDSEASRMRSTSASSPGTISAVPIATPPFAMAGRPASRRYRRRAARFRRTPACRHAAGASGRQIRHAACVSPIAVRPNTTISQSRSDAALSELDVDPARDACAVEQDRLLRQPGEMRAIVGLERDIELSRLARRAVDFFGGSRGQRQPRAFARGDLDVEAIAAGNTAGRVDEHRRKPLVFRRGKRTRSEPDSCKSPRRVTPSAACTSNAPRPARGWRQTPLKLRWRFRSASIPRPRGRVWTYSAIWRLISLGSRLARSQEYLTAPRSMTAKLSPSSQAKSRYCSTSTIAMLPRLRR